MKTYRPDAAPQPTQPRADTPPTRPSRPRYQHNHKSPHAPQHRTRQKHAHLPDAGIQPTQEPTDRRPIPTPCARSRCNRKFPNNPRHRNRQIQAYPPDAGTRTPQQPADTRSQQAGHTASAAIHPSSASRSSLVSRLMALPPVVEALSTNFAARSDFVRCRLMMRSSIVSFATI